MTTPAKPPQPDRFTRLLAHALAASALMSGLNAAIQVARLLIAFARHGP